jgi:hypothetical protein
MLLVLLRCAQHARAHQTLQVSCRLCLLPTALAQSEQVLSSFAADANIAIVCTQVLLRWRQECGFLATQLHVSLQQVSTGAVPMRQWLLSRSCSLARWAACMFHNGDQQQRYC